MIKPQKLLLYVMAIPILLSISGCTHLFNLEKDTQRSQTSSKPEDIYAREITRLNQIIKKDPNASRARKAHLSLAELYLDHNNPRRNYHKAHRHMQAYARLEKNVTDEDTLNWLAVLREIVLLSHKADNRNKQIAKMQGQLKKAQRQGGAAMRSNRTLKQKEVELMEKNASLEATNQKLLQTIEMLKHLDSRLEEKRRNLSN